MTIAVVQNADVVGSTITFAVTMGAAPTNGNLLVAMLFYQGAAPATDHPAASGWTQQSTFNAHTAFTADESVIVYSKVAGAGESTTQTPATNTGTGYMIVWEVSGAAATFAAALDVHETIQAANTTSLSVTALTASGSGELALLGYGGRAVFTGAPTIAGASFVQDKTTAGSFEVGGGAHKAAVSGSTGSPTLTWPSASGNGISYAMAVLQAASGGETGTITSSFTGVSQSLTGSSKNNATITSSFTGIHQSLTAKHTSVASRLTGNGTAAVAHQTSMLNVTANMGAGRYSAYMKQGTERYGYLTFIGRTPTENTIGFVVYDLQAGVVSFGPSNGAGTPSIKPAGNGWWLCSIDYPAFVASTQFDCRVGVTNVSNSNSSSASGYVLFWGIKQKANSESESTNNVPNYNNLAAATWGPSNATGTVSGEASPDQTIYGGFSGITQSLNGSRNETGTITSSFTGISQQATSIRIETGTITSRFSGISQTATDVVAHVHGSVTTHFGQFDQTALVTDITAVSGVRHFWTFGI